MGATQDQGASNYSTVFALGHKAIANIFDDPVLIEEKIDGSQFSFGLINGEWWCKSKKRNQCPVPDKMFLPAIKMAESLDLHPGWIYRTEFLMRPKHNALAYDRVPSGNLILFDVKTGMGEHLMYDEKAAEASRLGLECVPRLYQGKIDNFEQLMGFLERESILGGTKIEGVVVKNYDLYTKEKKFACGKFVSEHFKEVHHRHWHGAHPTGKDMFARLVEMYCTEARWEKAVQHLKENGELEGEPRDIGKLCREIPDDIKKECEEEIKAILFAHTWPKLRRAVLHGMPEWYKERLAKQAFEG